MSRFNEQLRALQGIWKEKEHRLWSVVGAEAFRLRDDGDKGQRFTITEDPDGKAVWGSGKFVLNPAFTEGAATASWYDSTMQKVLFSWDFLRPHPPDSEDVNADILRLPRPRSSPASHGKGYGKKGYKSYHAYPANSGWVPKGVAASSGTQVWVPKDSLSKKREETSEPAGSAEATGRKGAAAPAEEDWNYYREERPQKWQTPYPRSSWSGGAAWSGFSDWGAPDYAATTSWWKSNWEASWTPAWSKGSSGPSLWASSTSSWWEDPQAGWYPLEQDWGTEGKGKWKGKGKSKGKGKGKGKEVAAKEPLNAIGPEAQAEAVPAADDSAPKAVVGSTLVKTIEDQEERRFDANVGESSTYAEFRRRYGGEWRKQEIDAYWATCSSSMVI